MFSLAQVKVGETAQVKSLPESPSLRKQLLSMGFTSAIEVKVVRRAPLGDPIEYRLRGYSVSLRRAEAEQVGVACCGSCS
ncbi:MAG: ferrous iron transport protein A [Kangiellaceae bacterium]|nr:ferrous iron transport protein A [Kangiellaceae bacterium]|tara:strand:+ start:2122 stop:2361 length:240 start_codon:yes stop_codon:yes gene_type:complete